MNERDWHYDMKQAVGRVDLGRGDVPETLLRALSGLTTGSPVVIAVDGRALGALVTLDDIEDLIDNALADEALAEPGRSIPYETFRKGLGLH